MKKKIAALVLAGFGALAAGPALANSVDVQTITCADAKKGDAESLVVYLAWIDGFVGGQADDTMLDLDRFNNNIDAAVKLCDAQPSRSLLDVMKEAEGIQ